MALIKLPDINVDTILKIEYRTSGPPTFLKVRMADTSAWTRGSVEVTNFYDGGNRGKIAMSVLGSNTIYTTYVRKDRHGIYEIPPLEGFQVATVEDIDKLLAVYNHHLIEAQARVHHYEKLRMMFK